MANADRVVGVAGYISFAGQVIAGFRNFDVEQSVDTVDKSAGSETSKSYISTLKDGTAKLTYMYEGAAGTAITTKFKVWTSGTLLWGPEGTAAGKPKGGVMAIVTGHSKPFQYEDVVTRSVDFQFTGDMLFDDEEDVWP